jgi:hypothetical protein
MRCPRGARRASGSPSATTAERPADPAEISLPHLANLATRAAKVRLTLKRVQARQPSRSLRKQRRMRKVFSRALGVSTRRLTAPVLLVSGWTLLTVAWIFGNPPFASPDEGANYLRALEVGRGRLITTRAPDAARGKTERQTKWLRSATYTAQVPPGLAPLPADCYVHDSDKPAACLDRFVPPTTTTTATTYVGNYEPLPYLITGLPMRELRTPAAALRVGRAVNGAIVLALLGLAVALLWDPRAGAVSYCGLLLAVTPMVLFCGASLTGSGLEIAAGVAFFAALLRLGRHAGGTASPSRWVWGAAALSGAALALARPLGPLWVALLVVLAAAAIRPRPLLSVMQRCRRPAWSAAAAVLVAVGLNRAWEAGYGSRTPLSIESLRGALWPAVGEWWRASSELIGKFGYLEYRITWLYVAWFGLVFAVAAMAFQRSTRRERIVLALAFAFAVVFPMVMWIGGVRLTGFGMQGRYVLPVLVAIPMLTGEFLYRRRAHLTDRGARALTSIVPLAVAFMQFGAWYVAARRSAVGLEGSGFFVTSAQWSPPAGWVGWLLIAATGAVAIAASATKEVRRPAPRPPSPIRPTSRSAGEVGL